MCVLADTIKNTASGTVLRDPLMLCVHSCDTAMTSLPWKWKTKICAIGCEVKETAGYYDGRAMYE